MNLAQSQGWGFDVIKTKERILLPKSRSVGKKRTEGKGNARKESQHSL